MKYLKNKTVVGIIAIVFGLLICFIISPLYNRALEAKSKIIRVDKFIEKGSLINSDDVKVVEVGSYNLPEGVLIDEKEVIGKYAVADMYKDESMMKEKISDTPLSEAEYLEGMDGSYGAISITLQSFAAGLSGKLLPGDIVSIISTDTNTKGTKIIPELQYVKVLASTTQKGIDLEENKNSSDEEEENIPVTITLSVNRNQALALASIEQLEKSHLELVYRGTEEDSNRFLEQQKKIIEEMIAETAVIELEEIIENQEKAVSTTKSEIETKAEIPTEAGEKDE